MSLWFPTFLLEKCFLRESLVLWARLDGNLADVESLDMKKERWTNFRQGSNESWKKMEVSLKHLG